MIDALDFVYEAASLATLAVAGLSHARDRRHAVQVAAMLCAGCFAYNSTRYAAAYWLWPVMDAAAAWFVAVRHRRFPAPWKLVVVAAYAAQIMAHWRWQTGDKWGGPFYGYGLTLNALFLVQLGAVASSGSANVRRTIRDYVVDRGDRFRRRRFGLLHRAGHHRLQHRGQRRR